MVFLSKESLFSIPSLESSLRKIELAEASSGVELVDCVYVINLDERPTKWERMKALCDERGIHAQRVSGINGWKLPRQAFRDLQVPSRLSPGHLGCLLSHCSVIKDALDRRFEIIWVCEDDLEFVEDVKEVSRLLKIVDQIDPNWDVFYTDRDSKNEQGKRLISVGSDFRPHQKHQPLSYYTRRVAVTPEILQIGQRFGLYSALISRRGMEKIWDYFCQVDLWTSIDIDIHYIPGIRQYASIRDLVTVWRGNGISDTVVNTENW